MVAVEELVAHCVGIAHRPLHQWFPWVEKEGSWRVQQHRRQQGYDQHGFLATEGNCAVCRFSLVKWQTRRSDFASIHPKIYQ